MRHKFSWPHGGPYVTVFILISASLLVVLGSTTCLLLPVVDRGLGPMPMQDIYGHYTELTIICNFFLRQFVYFPVCYPRYSASFESSDCIRRVGRQEKWCAESPENEKCFRRVFLVFGASDNILIIFNMFFCVSSIVYWVLLHFVASALCCAYLFALVVLFCIFKLNLQHILSSHLKIVIEYHILLQGSQRKIS